MATYRVTYLNAGSDIVDPTISVNPSLNGLDFAAKTIDVTAYFNVGSSKLGITLNAVSVPDFTFLTGTQANYDTKVLAHATTRMDADYKI